MLNVSYNFNKNLQKFLENSKCSLEVEKVYRVEIDQFCVAYKYDTPTLKHPNYRIVAFKNITLLIQKFKNNITLFLT